MGPVEPMLSCLCCFRDPCIALEEGGGPAFILVRVAESNGK
jgi:hypothetical protein